MIGTLQIRSRPLRLGLLVNLRDRVSLRKAIEINSTVWGGYHNPLIPIFNKVPQEWGDLPRANRSAEIFTGYVRAFDPDVLVNCTSKEVPGFVGNFGLTIISAADIWKHNYWNKFGASWAIGIFDLLELIYKKHFRFVEKFPHSVKLLEFPKKDVLFWGAALGLIPVLIRKMILQEFGKALDISIENADTGTLKRFLQNPNIFFPLRIGRYSLKTAPRRRPLNADNLFFMDATSTLDIIDYWNLRASGRIVIPVPRQYRDDSNLRSLVRDFLKQSYRPKKNDHDIEEYGTFICSRSEDSHDMQAYASEAHQGMTVPRVSLQHWYPRMWEDVGRVSGHAEPMGLYFEDRAIDISKENQGIRFTALLPQFIESLGITNEPRYANDIQTTIYGSDEYIASVLPPSAGRNVMNQISGIRRDEWRVGRDGLVKLVSWETPTFLKLPLGQDVFFAWLKDLGWEPDPSSPGLIAKQMFAQLGGWVAWFNENALRFLEEMSAGKRASRGADINEICNRLASSDPEIAQFLPGKYIFDQLLDRKVFVIGHENQCPRCFKHSWYSLRDLDNILVCPRCLHSYGADQSVRKGKWRYKTTGPFSIDGYADGAYCVLAAINLFGHTLHHLALTPTTSFKAKMKNKKENLEADFGFLWRERNIAGESEGVAFGECKSFGEFEVIDFERMRTIAHEFPGAILVFATLRKKLNTSEIVEIKKIAKLGRRHWKDDKPINPVCVLTGHELMTHFGPPYCWRELQLEEKYSRILGLMEFCDATQQIHLGLPSWREDWHKAWERQRARKLAKLKTNAQQAIAAIPEN